MIPLPNTVMMDDVPFTITDEAHLDFTRSVFHTVDADEGSLISREYASESLAQLCRSGWDVPDDLTDETFMRLFNRQIVEEYYRREDKDIRLIYPVPRISDELATYLNEGCRELEVTPLTNQTSHDCFGWFIQVPETVVFEAPDELRTIIRDARSYGTDMVLIEKNSGASFDRKAPVMAKRLEMSFFYEEVCAEIQTGKAEDVDAYPIKDQQQATGFFIKVKHPNACGECSAKLKRLLSWAFDETLDWLILTEAGQ